MGGGGRDIKYVVLLLIHFLVLYCFVRASMILAYIPIPILTNPSPAYPIQIFPHISPHRPHLPHRTSLTHLSNRLINANTNTEHRNREQHSNSNQQSTLSNHAHVHPHRRMNLRVPGVVSRSEIVGIYRKLLLILRKKGKVRNSLVSSRSFPSAHVPIHSSP